MVESEARSPAPSSIVGALSGKTMLLTGVTGYVCFRLAEPIQRRLGTTGIHVLGRILGLILAGIAVQFVLDGLRGAGVIPPAPPAVRAAE